MCWQAWQADPQRDVELERPVPRGRGRQPPGRHPGRPAVQRRPHPGGRYDALDTVGDWQATVDRQQLQRQAVRPGQHGADYIRVYVTRQGFNPLTQPLGWADLELVGQIGNTPAAQWTPASPAACRSSCRCSAPGRTGRHMVYTIWQASHLDQSYYFCSDVNFGGGAATPPTAPPTPTPPPNAARADAAAAPRRRPRGRRSCSATYTVTGRGPGGFQARRDGDRRHGGDQRLDGDLDLRRRPERQQDWNATVTTSGSTVTARNVDYNGTLGAGANAGSASSAPPPAGDPHPHLPRHGLIHPPWAGADVRRPGPSPSLGAEPDANHPGRARRRRPASARR